MRPARSELERLASLERLVTCPVASLRVGQVRYGILCHETGGTVDDVTVYRTGEASLSGTGGNLTLNRR